MAISPAFDCFWKVSFFYRLHVFSNSTFHYLHLYVVDPLFLGMVMYNS